MYSCGSKSKRYRRVYSEKSTPIPALKCPVPNSEAASATMGLGSHRESRGLNKQIVTHVQRSDLTVCKPDEGSFSFPDAHYQVKHRWLPVLSSPGT